MKFILTTLALFASTAFAHWNYDKVIHNGKVVGDSYTYIRKTTNSNSPITDVTSNDMRCNAGGATAGSTQTLSVAAGDQVGFTLLPDFGHAGPQAVYISKAPTTAAAYDGSGSWTKIYSATISNITDAGMFWSTQGITSFVFTLPAAVPNGEYLLRAEGLALHSAATKGGAQWYMGCAQISVTGGGSGSLGNGVQIPGVYTGTEPGVLINIYYPIPKNYTAPGPALWPAGAIELHKVQQL